MASPKQYGGMVTFDASNTSIDLGQMVEIEGINFEGTGLTASQRLTLRDSATVGSGAILSDYITEGTADNADLWAGRRPRAVSALALDNNIVGGTWQLTVMIRR